MARAGQTRIKLRRERRQTVGRHRLVKEAWRDPFPMIPGTEPEKRVFAELVLHLHVFFIFQGQIEEFEKGSPMFGLTPNEYKPDFALPEYKIIIDPFSPFHHSLKGAAVRDKDKIARYSMAGWAYYHPWAVAPGVWDWNQYHVSGASITVNKTRISLHQGVNAKLNSYRKINRSVNGRKMGTLAMLQEIPELSAGPRYKLTNPKDIEAKRLTGYRIGQFLGAGANSVAAANRARAHPRNLKLRTSR